MFQSVFQVTFTNIHFGRQTWKDDIRQNAFQLGAFTIGQIELLQSDFQCTVILPVIPEKPLPKIHQSLDSALPMSGRVANHNSSFVVLNRTCEDFAGTRAEFTRQYAQRAVPCRAAVLILISLNRSIRILDLNNGA